MYLMSNIFIESEIYNLNGMNIILRATKYCGILICVFMCCNISRINKQKAVYIWSILLLTVFNMILASGGSGLTEIVIIVLCFSLSHVNVTTIFKCCINTLVIGHFIVISLSLLGILKDEISSRWFGNYMGEFFAGEYIRHQMGFLSSNQVPLTLMIVYLMIIAYKKNKIKMYEHILFLILNFWCFVNFGARVSFILIIFTFVAYEYIIILEKKGIKKYRIHIMWLSYIVCMLISISSAYMYNASLSVWKIANEIFYNRIRWSHAAIENYGISLLGYGLSAGKATGSYGENLIDNAYILVLIQRGIIIGLVVVAFWGVLTYKAEKKGNSYLVLSLTIIAIASLIDDHLITYKMIPFYCVFFLDDYMQVRTDEYKSRLKHSKKIKINIRRRKIS